MSLVCLRDSERKQDCFFYVEILDTWSVAGIHTPSHSFTRNNRHTCFKSGQASLASSLTTFSFALMLGNRWSGARDVVLSIPNIQVTDKPVIIKAFWRPTDIRSVFLILSQSWDTSVQGLSKPSFDKVEQDIVKYIHFLSWFSKLN